MTITVEGATTGHGRSASPSTNLTTTTAADLICALIYTEVTSGSPKTVTSVTSPGLTFARIGGVSNGVDNIELWAAPATSTLSAQAVVINLSGAPDGECHAVFGIAGLFNNANSKDTNGSVPAGSTYTTNPSLTISTDQAHDILIMAAGNHNSTTGQGGNPGGWTAINSFTLEGGGANWCAFTSCYQVVSAKQTGVSEHMGSQSGSSIMFVTALAGDNNNPANACPQTAVSVITG